MTQDLSKKVVAKNNLIKLVKALIIVLLVVTPAFSIYILQNKKIHNLEARQKVHETNSNTNSSALEESKTNIAPSDYSFYEDKERGFKFAYPEAWGKVDIETNWTAERGEYLIGTFSNNKEASFGGRGEDYRTLGRGGTPTDQAAFKVINSKAFWLNPQVSDSNEDQGYVRPVNEGYRISKTYNSQALITQNKYEDFIGYAYDSASFNLADNKNIYAITIVLKNPNSNDRVELDNIVKTFELI